MKRRLSPCRRVAAALAAVLWCAVAGAAAAQDGLPPPGDADTESITAEPAPAPGTEQLPPADPEPGVTVAPESAAQEVAPPSPGDADTGSVAAAPAPAPVPDEPPPAGPEPGVTAAPESATDAPPDTGQPPPDVGSGPSEVPALPEPAPATDAAPESAAEVIPDPGPSQPAASPPPSERSVPAPAATPPGPPPAPDAPASEPAAPALPPKVVPPALPWSFSVVAGYYRPRLGTLNRILQDTRLTMLQDPNFLLPRNQEFPFEQRNIAVDGLNGGALYGVEAFYNTGGPHSFGFTFSGWRAETIGRDRIILFLRSNVPPIEVPRSARYNLVLDRVFAEWRYHLFRDTRGKGVYLNLGFVGVTLATFTMDALVNVVHPELSFASVSSDESFGWGYTTRFGIGGEYPLASWLSIGGRANYVLATIRTMKVTKHFLSGFPNQAPVEPLSIRPGVPLPQQFFPPREGRIIDYAEITTFGDIQETAGNRRILPLELSGWEGLLEVSLRF